MTLGQRSRRTGSRRRTNAGTNFLHSVENALHHGEGKKKSYDDDSPRGEGLTSANVEGDQHKKGHASTSSSWHDVIFGPSNSTLTHINGTEATDAPDSTQMDSQSVGDTLGNFTDEVETKDASTELDGGNFPVTKAAGTQATSTAGPTVTTTIALKTDFVSATETTEAITTQKTTEEVETKEASTELDGGNFPVTKAAGTQATSAAEPTVTTTIASKSDFASAPETTEAITTQKTTDELIISTEEHESPVDTIVAEENTGFALGSGLENLLDEPKGSKSDGAAYGSPGTSEGAGGSTFENLGNEQHLPMEEGQDTTQHVSELVHNETDLTTLSMEGENKENDESSSSSLTFTSGKSEDSADIGVVTEKGEDYVKTKEQFNTAVSQQVQQIAKESLCSKDFLRNATKELKETMADNVSGAVTAQLDTLQYQGTPETNFMWLHALTKAIEGFSTSDTAHEMAGFGNKFKVVAKEHAGAVASEEIEIACTTNMTADLVHSLMDGVENAVEAELQSIKQLIHSDTATLLMSDAEYVVNHAGQFMKDELLHVRDSVCSDHPPGTDIVGPVVTAVKDAVSNEMKQLESAIPVAQTVTEWIGPIVSVATNFSAAITRQAGKEMRYQQHIICSDILGSSPAVTAHATAISSKVTEGDDTLNTPQIDTAVAAVIAVLCSMVSIFVLFFIWRNVRKTTRRKSTRRDNEFLRMMSGEEAHRNVV